MRLGLKMALSTLCCVALLFGICGSLLISLSFSSSLDREKASVKESYEMLLEAMSAMGSLDAVASRDDIASLLAKLVSGSSSTWQAMRLSTGDETIYEKGEIDAYSRNRGDIHGSFGSGGTMRLVNDVSASSVSESAYVPPALLLSGSCQIDETTVYLDAAHDISALYDERRSELYAFRIAFAVLVGVCAAIAFATAFVLTRPLSKLSRAAREMACGNLSSRSDVQTDDEVGSLSHDFDVMAAQIERNVDRMRDSLARQQRFMGNFAHEMKTPMTSVVGYADLIRRGELKDAEMAQAAQYLFDEGKRLEALSGKLLELFVLDGISEPPQPCNMKELARSVAAPLAEVWREQNITLSWQSDDCICLVDPDLVRSLLVNLLENARRATVDEDDAHVLLNIQMDDDDCIVSVEDNGCGIAEEELHRLTEEFYRVDKARSRAEGGVGLGLSLCARIMKAHGGRLEIESAVGSGTRVDGIFPGCAVRGKHRGGIHGIG